MVNKRTYDLRWAWGITRGYRGALCFYLILETLAIALSLGFVYWSKAAVDQAVIRDGQELKQALAGAAACLLSAWLIRLLARRMNEKTRIKMDVQLQNAAIFHQLRARWLLIGKWHSGDVQVRIHSDCREIVQMLVHTFPSFLLTVLRLMASAGFLWIMDPMLTLMILGISPLLLFSKLYFKKLRRLNTQLKTAESKFGHVLQDNLRLRASIRVLGLQGIRRQKTIESQQELAALRIHLLNFSLISQGVVRLTMHAGFLITFIWGVYRLYSGVISFGTLTAFLQLVGRVQTPILGMMQFVPQFVRFRTSVQRVQELMALETEPVESPQVISRPGMIRIKHLRFQYGDSLVIGDFSAALRAGEITALIGASGKGKTTLIRLLLALIRPDSGSIELEWNGYSVPLQAKHRCNIAYVPQGDKLFSGTIRENLTLSRQAPQEAALQRALYLACAEFVYDLPDGLDTQVGETGQGLSEGQAQRIAIARALMRDCSIWLFDEVTSALDNQTAAKLMERLREAGAEKIILIVTHDVKLAKSCDRVLYIE